MKYKVLYHMMPWEIDYALLTFTQFKKSKYYLNNEDSIIISPCLNLSSYIINWEESKIPKEFFINKLSQISSLLIDYKYEPIIYDGDELYGHLDFQRNAISSDVDHYINVCPDMYFSEHLLSLLIESSKQIKNKYFVITPEIYKLWDQSWDEITSQKYLNIPYNEWNKVDTFDIRADLKADNNVSLSLIQNSKWAGWFDLYNKEMWEQLCHIHDDWKGYGPHDWYSLLITEYTKSQGVDFQQYVLRGQTIFEYSVGPLKNGGFSKYYKDLLVLKDIPNQRQQFESQMQEYLQKGIQQLKEKNIL
jgi:hypothetical protein